MITRSILLATCEAKRPYQKNLALGFGISGAAHILAIVLILLIIYLTPPPPIPVSTNNDAPTQVWLPPPILPGPVVGEADHPRIPPKDGDFIPVADKEAPSDVEAPTQNDLAAFSPESPSIDLNENINIDVDKILNNIIPPPGVFTPYDDPPTTVNSELPIYPELAARAGIEGKVWIEVAIDKDGQVRDVRVLKVSPPDLGFEESATQAAWKTTWKPAISNGLPIAVRVSYAVCFKLK
jgi:protein TonB